MYEIWLMLVIVYEIALSIWPWLLALAVLWLLLMMLARGGRAGGWSTCLPKAITLGVLVGVVIFFVTPIWNKSGLGEMKYWVDWANLLGIAVAWAVAGTLFAWPLLTWIRKSRQTA